MRNNYLEGISAETIICRSKNLEETYENGVRLIQG